MQLPNHCPFENTPLQQFLKAEVYCRDCCRAVGGYLAADEPPLCLFRETEEESYRFAWRSSFNGRALVHVARKGDSVELRARRTSGSRLLLRGPLLANTLSLDEWERLHRVLAISNFWSLDATDEQFGLDGAWWLIEGRRDDLYHSVERWCPRGVVRDLGQLFAELAGASLAELKLY